jgi:DNA-binding CsgD family transcriptional regulator
MGKRKLTDEQEQSICARYKAGENSVQLGHAFNLHPESVRNILKRNSIERRSTIEAHGGLSSEAEAEVCARYKAGENSVQLGAAFGIAPTTVTKTLKRNGVELRRMSESRTGLSLRAESEISRRYSAGENTPELSAAFGISRTAVRNILLRNNIQLRSRSEARGGLTAKAETEVCIRYTAGESTTQLGAAFKIARTTVCSILQRNNIERRSIAEANGGLSLEAKVEACVRYVAGENTTQLGAAFGVAPTTIWKALQRGGIECRNPTGHRDSVQHILDCTGHHCHARDCEFYLYELARYANTHCKPGIAFDVEQRVDDEYGQSVLRICFATRAEAYFLEQAVLDATRGCADCPDDLWGWDGATEVRAMPANDLEPIVLRLAEDLEEMGPWAFAAAYVPMTAAQRAICQKRDLIAAPLHLSVPHLGRPYPDQQQVIGNAGPCPD